MTLEQLTLLLTDRANRSGSCVSVTINDDMCKEN
jgi:hypothetical protein